jgi:hypothetical protein
VRWTGPARRGVTGRPQSVPQVDERGLSWLPKVDLDRSNQGSEHHD